MLRLLTCMLINLHASVGLILVLQFPQKVPLNYTVVEKLIGRNFVRKWNFWK